MLGAVHMVQELIVTYRKTWSDLDFKRFGTLFFVSLKSIINL